MKLMGRFLIAELVWATGIFVLLMTVGILTSAAPSSAEILGWLARALALAAFPGGISIAPAVFEPPHPWRQLLLAAAAACLVSAVVVLLQGVIIPLVSGEARSLPQLARTMSALVESWESRNHAAWHFYSTFTTGLITLLYAAIGVQVGIWATYSLPRSLRRALYWIAGLGLLITGFAIWDTTYETVVLHTAADASFAAFYPVLVPLSICAGLALPTLALLRGVQLPRTMR
jgi:hypothetical protein